MKEEEKKSSDNDQIKNNPYLINRRFDKKNAGLFALILLLCSGLIITSNYYFSTKVITEIHQVISDMEYSKVWWETNYMLLREIQKEQMIKYIDDVTKKDPAYIEWLKRKIKNPDEIIKENILSADAIDKFKSDTYIQWNTWAKVSIIEFSDFECSFCREFHSAWIVSKIISNNKDNVNYIFKNVPSQKHENATKLAQGWKCILTKTNWENYINYINSIFKTWTGTSIDWMYALVDKLWVKKADLDKCIVSEEIKTSVKKEIWQAIYFWLKTTPSIIILNNIDGKYYIFEWAIDEATLNSKIEELIK